MPNENPTPTPAERLSTVEREVLYALADEDGTQSIWTVQELGREIENLNHAHLAVQGLHQAGLIHRTNDGLIIATRAGVHAVELTGHVI